MGIRITGEVAELRYAYRTAATLRNFSMIAENDATHLLADIVSQDSMWLSRRPLVCVIPGRPWKWPILTLQVTDDNAAIRATIGPCEG